MELFPESELSLFLSFKPWKRSQSFGKGRLWPEELTNSRSEKITSFFSVSPLRRLLHSWTFVIFSTTDFRSLPSLFYLHLALCSVETLKHIYRLETRTELAVEISNLRYYARGFFPLTHWTVLFFFGVSSPWNCSIIVWFRPWEKRSTSQMMAIHM